jgi:formate dehydrogenase subunit delta
MSDTELAHLIQMANQIAVNFSFHADAEDRVLDHLTRFWAPSMRQSLLDYVREGGAELDAVVVAAASRLASK